MKQIIPIVHCFDNNYVVPAAVAFYSLLDTANRNYFYEIYVLHENITTENQNKLKECIKNFENSALKFIEVNEFSESWNKLKIKGHYSKEVLYKMKMASIIREHKKIIVSDVDVIYLNDISKDFIKFYENDNFNYLAGVFPIDRVVHFYQENYAKDFSKEEISHLKMGGGYFFMNSELILQNNLEEKFETYFIENNHRLRQSEQDVFNLCCYSRIGKLPLKNMVCTYIYDFYNRSDINDQLNYSREEILDAYDNPIQLHYATSTKPWNKLNSTKANLWIETLLKTNFYTDFFNSLEETFRPQGVKKIFKIKVPLSKRRSFILELKKKKV